VSQPSKVLGGTRPDVGSETVLAIRFRVLNISAAFLRP
jgi:hypothetical protein